MRVLLMEEGETDWAESLNAFMLSEGLACLDKEAMNDAPEEA